MIRYLDNFLPSKRAIIFDFDGVLVRLNTDYHSLRADLKDYFEKKFGFSHLFIPLYPTLFTLKETHGSQVFQEAREIILKYEMQGLENAHINRNLIRYVGKMEPTVKKAIFSSNLKDTIEAFLQEKNLKSFFDLVISFDDVMKTKPDPEGLLMILDKLKIVPAEAIFIGDREVDLEAGMSAGIKTILIPNWINGYFLK